MGKELKKFIIETAINKDVDSEEARRALMQAVYNISVVFYENIGEHGFLTDGKKLIGNGHHMAQELSRHAGAIWDERLV